MGGFAAGAPLAGDAPQAEDLVDGREHARGRVRGRIVVRVGRDVHEAFHIADFVGRRGVALLVAQIVVKATRKQFELVAHRRAWRGESQHVFAPPPPSFLRAPRLVVSGVYPGPTP